jgi:hypothetical protein
MSSVLIFMTNWRKWQRVLHCCKGFGLIHSVRCGLWLARGSALAPRVPRSSEFSRTAHAA